VSDQKYNGPLSLRQYLLERHAEWSEGCGELMLHIYVVSYMAPSDDGPVVRRGLACALDEAHAVALVQWDLAERYPNGVTWQSAKLEQCLDQKSSPAVCMVQERKL
jgi:hypothetical protein